MTHSPANVPLVSQRSWSVSGTVSSGPQGVSKPATDEATVTAPVHATTAFLTGVYTDSASLTRTDGLPSVPGS